MNWYDFDPDEAARDDARDAAREDHELERALADARSWRCNDRSCGADDCPTCRPGTWRQAVEEGLHG